MCTPAPPAETPNEVLQAKEDLRFKLAQLTIALGEALLKANATDALGIKTLPGATQRVFGEKGMTLGDTKTRVVSLPGRTVSTPWSLVSPKDVMRSARR